MANPVVNQAKKTGIGYLCSVSIGSHAYTVKIPHDYYFALTGGAISVEQLVELSFKFLLEREGPESILPKFDIHQINTYFPDYESVIRKQLKD